MAVSLICDTVALPRELMSANRLAKFGVFVQTYDGVYRMPTRTGSRYLTYSRNLCTFEGFPREL